MLEFIKNIVIIISHYVILTLRKFDADYEKELHKNTTFITYSKKTCPICMEKLVGYIYTTPCCKQRVHLECFRKCSHMASTTCPFCRHTTKKPTSRDVIKSLEKIDIYDMAEQLPNDLKPVKYDPYYFFNLLEEYIV